MTKNKKLKTIIASVLSACLVLGCCTAVAFAQTYTYDDTSQGVTFSYKLDGTLVGVELIDENTVPTTLAIPDKINNVAIKKLIIDYDHSVSSYDVGKNLTSIDFGNVEQIGYGGDLVVEDAIDYDSSVEDDIVNNIQNSRPNLKEIIGGFTYRFSSNPKLVSVTGNSVSAIGTGVFDSCDMLNNVNFPNLKYISDYAFQNDASISSIDLSDVKHIGTSAFTNCISLETINLSSCVTESRTLTEEENNRYSLGVDSLLQLDNCYWLNVSEEAFSGCTKLNKITFPAENIALQKKIFKNCSSLKELNISNAVQIDESAFSGCSGLTNVSLASCKEILFSAFEGCNNISTIYLPNAEEIGDSAFSNNSSLTSLTLGKHTNIGASAFENCTNLSTIITSYNKKAVTDKYNCSNGILSILNNAVYVPGNVGEKAFAGTKLRNSNIVVYGSTTATSFATSNNLTKKTLLHANLDIDTENTNPRSSAYLNETPPYGFDKEYSTYSYVLRFKTYDIGTGNASNNANMHFADGSDIYKLSCLPDETVNFSIVPSVTADSDFMGWGYSYNRKGIVNYNGINSYTPIGSFKDAGGYQDFFANYKAKVYSVSYISGIKTLTTQTYAIGNEVTVEDPPEIMGYNSEGWSETENATTPQYAAGSTITGDGLEDGTHIDLYLVTSPITYTVNYTDKNGKTISSETHNYGDSFTLPNYPGTLGDNERFAGWYPSTVTSSGAPTGGTTTGEFPSEYYNSTDDEYTVAIGDNYTVLYDAQANIYIINAQSGKYLSYASMVDPKSASEMNLEIGKWYGVTAEDNVEEITESPINSSDFNEIASQTWLDQIIASFSNNDGGLSITYSPDSSANDIFPTSLYNNNTYDIADCVDGDTKIMYTDASGHEMYMIQMDSDSGTEYTQYAAVMNSAYATQVGLTKGQWYGIKDGTFTPVNESPVTLDVFDNINNKTWARQVILSFYTSNGANYITYNPKGISTGSGGETEFPSEYYNSTDKEYTVATGSNYTIYYEAATGYEEYYVPMKSGTDPNYDAYECATTQASADAYGIELGVWYGVDSNGNYTKLTDESFSVTDFDDVPSKRWLSQVVSSLTATNGGLSITYDPTNPSADLPTSDEEGPTNTVELNTTRLYKARNIVKNLASTQGEVVTYTAVITPDTYTVHYNANGGTGEMADSTFKFDQNCKLSENTFTKDDTDFWGWSLTPGSTDYENTNYDNEASVYNLAGELGTEITLYAVYRNPAVDRTVEQTVYRNVPVDNNSYRVDVYLTQSSSYTVTAPKEVILDGKAGKTNEGTYQVGVVGDLASNETVNVKPIYNKDNAESTNFAMEQKGKKPASATIKQDQTTFTYADGVRPDEAVYEEGTVSAKGLSAGSWKGIFYFSINLIHN